MLSISNKELQINEEIRDKELRIIDSDGSQLGFMSSTQALELAESKNLDLVKISREISIEKRYLEGLENEDSSVFPGEAYLVGFLKNYSNYLELDTELVLKLYHNKQIQESPLPEGLYEKKSSKRILPFLIPVAIFVVLVVTISFLYPRKRIIMILNLLFLKIQKKINMKLTKQIL